MSLYEVQKFLFQLNRDPRVQADYQADRRAALTGYELTGEEVDALVEPDFGKLFHLGVNGQILMHFGALHQVPWRDYLDALAEGLERYGPVREGVYTVTGYEGVEAHTSRLGQTRPEVS
ncbi:MAG: aromatic ring-opening dioxygenase subunit LigA [Acidimicrobiales bacterium]